MGSILISISSLGLQGLEVPSFKTRYACLRTLHHSRLELSGLNFPAAGGLFLLIIVLTRLVVDFWFQREPNLILKLYLLSFSVRSSSRCDVDVLAVFTEANLEKQIM